MNREPQASPETGQVEGQEAILLAIQENLAVNPDVARDLASIQVACPQPGEGRQASLGEFMASEHGADKAVQILESARDAKESGANLEESMKRALGFAAIVDQDTGKLARVEMRGETAASAPEDGRDDRDNDNRPLGGSNGEHRRELNDRYQNLQRASLVAELPPIEGAQHGPIAPVIARPSNPVVSSPKREAVLLEVSQENEETTALAPQPERLEPGPVPPRPGPTRPTPDDLSAPKLPYGVTSTIPATIVSAEPEQPPKTVEEKLEPAISVAIRPTVTLTEAVAANLLDSPSAPIQEPGIFDGEASETPIADEEDIDISVQTDVEPAEPIIGLESLPPVEPAEFAYKLIKDSLDASAGDELIAQAIEALQSPETTVSETIQTATAEVVMLAQQLHELQAAGADSTDIEQLLATACAQLLECLDVPYNDETVEKFVNIVLEAYEPSQSPRTETSQSARDLYRQGTHEYKPQELTLASFMMRARRSLLSFQQLGSWAVSQV